MEPRNMTRVSLMVVPPEEEIAKEGVFDTNTALTTLRLDGAKWEEEEEEDGAGGKEDQEDREGQEGEAAALGRVEKALKRNRAWQRSKSAMDAVALMRAAAKKARARVRALERQLAGERQQAQGGTTAATTKEEL